MTVTELYNKLVSEYGPDTKVGTKSDYRVYKRKGIYTICFFDKNQENELNTIKYGHGGMGG